MSTVNYLSLVSNYTSNVQDGYNCYVLDATHNDITLSVADATAADGNTYLVVRIDGVVANTVTLVPSVTGQTINGATSYTLTAVGVAGSSGVQILATGGNWYVTLQ
jgi:hypothetical protein